MRRADIIALLVAALLTVPVVAYGSTIESKVIGEAWVVGLVITLRVAPRIFKSEWARGVSDPNDPARRAFAEAAKTELLPEVGKLVEAQLGIALAEIRGEIGTVRAAIDPKAIADLRADIAPLVKIVDELRPMLLNVDGTDDQGKPVKINAQLAQLLELAEWTQKAEAMLAQVPPKEYLEKLPAAIEEAVKKGTAAALTVDFAAEYEQQKLQMRQETMRKKAAEMAEQFVTEAAFAQANPQLVANGQRLEKIDAAIGAWMQRNKYPEAYKGLVEEFVYPLLAQQAGGAQRMGGAPAAGPRRLTPI